MHTKDCTGQLLLLAFILDVGVIIVFTVSNYSYLFVTLQRLLTFTHFKHAQCNANETKIYIAYSHTLMPIISLAALSHVHYLSSKDSVVM